MLNASQEGPLTTSRRIQRLFACVLLLTVFTAAPLYAGKKQDSRGSWKFAVSGDSRNCGDIVMPGIAQGVRRDGAAFFGTWVTIAPSTPSTRTIFAFTQHHHR